MPSEPKFMLKRPREERIEMMTRDINNFENVVISGSLVDWGDVLIPYFSLGIRIEINPNVRIARLIQREKERYGSRIEPDGDMHQQHLKFIEWAKSYDTGGINMRSKVKHDEWQKLISCELLILNGADSLEDNFTRIKQALNK